MKFVSILCLPDKETSESRHLLYEYDLLRFTIDRYPMLYTNKSNVKEELGVDSDYALVILRSFDTHKEILPLNEKSSIDEINKFIQKLKEPYLKFMEYNALERIFKE